MGKRTGGDASSCRRLRQSWLVMQKIRFSSAFDGSAHQHLQGRWESNTQAAMELRNRNCRKSPTTLRNTPTGCCVSPPWGGGGGRGLVELSGVTTTAPIALTAMSEALRLPGPACLPGGGQARLC